MEAVRLSIRWIMCFILSMIIPTNALTTGTILVEQGSTWSFLDDGSNQGTTWRGLGFDESEWDTGTAELGYGDGDESTLVSFGSISSTKHITTYFRNHFTVEDPDSISALTLEIKRDDGAVIYLNGTEVLRTNMPEGNINFLTMAVGTVSGTGEEIFHQSSVNPNVVMTGDNVVAVEIHQGDPTSSDISFDLSLTSMTYPVTAPLVRSPYLQQGTPTSIVVRWRTDVLKESRVSYGSSPIDLSTTVALSTLKTEHEVELTGLQPNTKYFYSIGSTSETLAGADPNHFFVTAPLAGTPQPTRIWVIGDSGRCADNLKGCSDAAAVRDAYLNFAGSTLADVWLLLGDNAYKNGTDDEYTRGFFEVYPTVMRNTVVWPIPGNHEIGASDSLTQNGPYYQSFTIPRNGEAGGIPSETEAYYSFDHGNIHFIALDSSDTSRSVGGSMYNWLQSDLADTDQDFIIVFWHHPPYTKGSHDSDNVLDSEGRMQEMRENFLPLLEAYGVDLQLSGHSHAYERSILIDGHYAESNTFGSQHIVDNGNGDPRSDGAYQKPTLGPGGHEGTVYSVVGSSSKTSGGLLNHPVMNANINIEGSMVIDVNGGKLDAYFIDKNRNVRDHFQILKGVTQPTKFLTVSLIGSGTVTSNPSGITCENTCSADFPRGTCVTLTATPSNGSNFAGWSGGGCSGVSPCTVTLTQAKTVTAEFIIHTPETSTMGRPFPEPHFLARR